MVEKHIDPNASREGHPVANGHDRTPDPSQFDARFDHGRDELTAAAQALGGPLRTVNRADAAVRKLTPLLPYAVAAVTVIGIAAVLFRGKKVKPLVLIGAGLDIWRLWKGFQASSSSREFLALQATAARSANSGARAFHPPLDSSQGASKT